jgi:hypothetical protein
MSPLVPGQHGHGHGDAPDGEPNDWYLFDTDVEYLRKLIVATHPGLALVEPLADLHEALSGRQHPRLAAAQDLGNYIFPRWLAAQMWEVDWRDADKIFRGLATVGLESNFYERNVGVNPDGSKDRGIWQINDRAHPDCPDSVAFDYKLATSWVFNHLYKPAHFDYTDWAAYNNLVKPFLAGTLPASDPRYEVTRSRVIYAAEAVSNWLKERYGVLA